VTKQATQIFSRRRCTLAQPARQTLPDMGEGTRVVNLEQRTAGRTEGSRHVFADLPVSFGERLQAQHRVEVVAQNLGGQVLLMREPAQSGDSLQIKAMLDSFKRFLYSPALMVEVAKQLAGKRTESNKVVIKTRTLPFGATWRTRRTV
jgi:hypothetical protein